MKVLNGRLAVISWIGSIVLLMLFEISLNDSCFYKQDGTGLLNTYHEIYSNEKCYPCPSECKSCSSITDQSCQQGNCQDYYFYNSTSFRCQQCQSFCKKCTGPNQNHCQICVQGYYFDQVANKCKTCPFGSSSCKGMTVYSCVQRFYLDPQSYTCRKCTSQCLQCTSSVTCQGCEQGFFLYQNNLCKSCQTFKCRKCVDQTRCYQCFDGYFLDAQSKCSQQKCSQSSCLQCLGTNSSACTQCRPQYFLYYSECHFGSSLLCESGLNGSSYGKCLNCIQQVTYSGGQFPSYCLLSKPTQRRIKRQFKSFSSYFLCNAPEFLTNDASKEHKIPLKIQPLFEIQLQIRLISQAKSQSISVGLSDQEGLGSYASMNTGVRKAQTFHCQQKNLILDTQQMLVHIIYQSFYVTSLSPQVLLTISDTYNSTPIYISQVLIRKQICLVQNCQACLTTQLCSHCVGGYLLQEHECRKQCSLGYYTNIYQGQCVYQCQLGYYLSLQLSSCEKCPVQCLTCSTLILCNSCQNGYFFYKDSCLKNCTDKTTYESVPYNECKKCQNPCKTCSISGQNCTSCLQGNLLNNKCISECTQPYFAEFSNSNPVCTLCSASCKSCSVNANFCTSCPQNFTLMDGKCLNQCSTGFFQFYTLKNNVKQTKCLPCSPICKSCFALPNNCSSCSLGYLFRANLQQLLYFNDSFSNRQIQNLFEILNKNSNSNLYQSGTCLSKCPLLYFFQDQAIKRCQRCAQNCQKCLNTQKCLRCVNDTFLQDEKCVTKCNSSYFYMHQPTSTCMKCQTPCLTCLTDNQGSNCLGCIQGYYYFKAQVLISNETTTQNNTSTIAQNQTPDVNVPQEKAGQCLVRCPKGYYRNNSTDQHKCDPCPLECSQCETQTICVSCQGGYILSDVNRCILTPQCSQGHFFNNSTNKCQKCRQTCKSCLGYQYFCTQCQNPSLYLLIERGLCLQQCTQGYFDINVDLTNQTLVQINSFTLPLQLFMNKNYTQIYLCVKCPQYCTACTSRQICTKCSDEYVLFREKCLSTCPAYYFISFTSQGSICQQCSQKCLQCLSGRFCTKCNSQAILTSNQCYSSCLDGFYLKQTKNDTGQIVRSCNRCPQKCQTCNSQIDCQSCGLGYFLMYNSTTQFAGCKQICEEGFYSNKLSRKCQQCKRPCKTCKNNFVCLSCQDNLTLLNQNCIENCPQTFYLKKIDGSDDLSLCVSCPTPCRTCQSLSKCMQCNPGFYFFSQTFQCLATCPQKYVQNPLTNKCGQCEKPCQNCLSDRNQCQTCIQGFYLRNKLCLSICPTGTYLKNNGNNSTCQNCLQSCKTCDSLNFCTLCRQKYHLLAIINQTTAITSKNCVSECPKGKFLDRNKNSCQECHQTCKRCTKDKFTCTSCYDKKLLLRNLCVQACPKFYYQNTANYHCNECGKWCENCVDNKKCEKCSSGYLFEGQCRGQCPLKYYQNKQTMACSKCRDGCRSCRSQYVCEDCIFELGYVLYSSRCIPYPCPIELYYFVEQNQCIETCPFLTNKRQRKCHLNQCPFQLILSSQGDQCLFDCFQDQFVSYDQNNGGVKCKSKQLLLDKGIQVEELPQFTLQIVPSYGHLVAVLTFSFKALEGVKLEQVQGKIKFSLDYLSAQDNSKKVQGQLTSFNPMQRSYVSQTQTNASLEPTYKNVSFSLYLEQITSNTALFHIEIEDDTSNRNFLEQQFQLGLRITAYMLNPYRDLISTINTISLPLQNERVQRQFTYLNYYQQEISAVALSVIIWLLVIAVATLLSFHLYIDHRANQKDNQTKSAPRVYLFASTIQFLQAVFFLCFVSLNLPPVLQVLFYSLRFTAGNLVLQSILQSQSERVGRYEAMISPWQFYKFCRDIDLFRNLADVLLIFGVVLVLIVISKGLNRFTSILSVLTKKILRNKTLLLQLLAWLFSPIIGFYALINIFFAPDQKKYRASLQSLFIYKFVAYILAISFFSAQLYFFYRHYFRTDRFDKGIDRQKKKLGTSIPLYRFLRKCLLVFFLAYEYQNSIYAICIFLLSTAVILAMVYWYEPYKNPFRQKLSVVQQGSLFVIFAQITIFFLNPDYYRWASYIIVVHFFSHMVLLMVYPSYCLYSKIKWQQDPEVYDSKQASTQQQITTALQEKNFKGKQVHFQDNHNPRQTRMNFGTIIKKKQQQDILINQQQHSADEADQSEQGQMAKKNKNINPINSIGRLANKQKGKVRQFKNYEFSSEEENQQEDNIQNRSRTNTF